MLYQPPPSDQPPPPWIRGRAGATCTGVSLAHGSNDGQKGIGLVMLILIGILPAHYALNPEAGPGAGRGGRSPRPRRARGPAPRSTSRSDGVPALSSELARRPRDARSATPSLRDIPEAERWRVRADLLRLDKALAALEAGRRAAGLLGRANGSRPSGAGPSSDGLTDYAPTWVLIAVATALGVGTMVGWKRIVVTVGEKIGKTHLTYAQGAAPSSWR